MGQREIKFRGLRIDNGQWAYGYYVYDDNRDRAYIYSVYIGESGHFSLHRDEVMAKSVGQFSGLIDKKSNRIFEGDILSIPYITPVGTLTEDENYRANVEFRNGSFQHHGYSSKVYHDLKDWCNTGKMEYVPNVGEIYEILDTTLVTVLGNVHQHPELLK